MSEGELGSRLPSARVPPCLLTGRRWVRGRGVGRGLPGSLRLGVFPSTGPGPRPGEQALTHIPTVPRQKVGHWPGSIWGLLRQGCGASSACSELPSWELGPEGGGRTSPVLGGVGSGDRGRAEPCQEGWEARCVLPRASRSLTRSPGLQAWWSVWARAGPQVAAAPHSPCWVDGPSPQAGSSMNPTPLKVACPRGPLWRQGQASLLSGQGGPARHPKAPEGAAPCVLGGVGGLKWGRTWGGRSVCPLTDLPKGSKPRQCGVSPTSAEPSCPLPCRIRAPAMGARGGSNGSWELGDASPDPGTTGSGNRASPIVLCCGTWAIMEPAAVRSTPFDETPFSKHPLSEPLCWLFQSFSF